MAKNFITMLNRNVKSGHFNIVSDLRGKPFSFIKWCVSYMVIILISYIPSIPNLLRVFIKKWIEILTNAFSASWYGHLILSSFLLMWCNTDWFARLNHPYIPRINITWSWCMIISMCYEIWFKITLILKSNKDPFKKKCIPVSLMS